MRMQKCPYVRVCNLESVWLRHSDADAANISLWAQRLASRLLLAFIRHMSAPSQITPHTHRRLRQSHQITPRSHFTTKSKERNRTFYVAWSLILGLWCFASTLFSWQFSTFIQNYNNALESVTFFCVIFIMLNDFNYCLVKTLLLTLLLLW